MTIAVVTAAGVGSRMNLEIPKQFYKVDGKPIIIYTLEVLQRNSNIDHVVVACLDGWLRELKDLVEHYGLSKVQRIVPGGGTGQESIMNCLDAVSDIASDDELVMVHDGNRPLVDDFVINESVRVALEHGGAVATIPMVEAVLNLEITEGPVPVASTAIDRDLVVRTQTPHTFPFRELVDSYNEMISRGIDAVAPCTVMVELGHTIFCSAGSELNMKITNSNDLAIFEALVRNNRWQSGE